MTATELNLEEAKFFLGKLKENRFAKKFDHYINAYLNSARSVT